MKQTFWRATDRSVDSSTIGRHCALASGAIIPVAMSEAHLLSVIAKRIIIKFWFNEHVKAADILQRVRSQFSNKTLPQVKVFKRRMSAWKECIKGAFTWASNLDQVKSWQVRKQVAFNYICKRCLLSHLPAFNLVQVTWSLALSINLPRVDVA